MSFFFSIVYLVIEYLRPQSMYAILSGLPLAQIAIIGSIISFVLERRKLANYNFQNILILLFLFWMFVSYLFSIDRESSWQPLVDFIKVIVVYFLLINIINEKQRLYWFAVVLILIHLKFSQFLTRGMLLRGIGLGKSGLYAGAGLLSNPGDLATALATVFGISYYLAKLDHARLFNFFKVQWLFIAGAITIPIGIIASNTRGALLAIAVSSLGIVHKSKRKFLAVLLLILAGFVLIALIPNWERYQQTGTDADTTTQIRTRLLRISLQMLEEYPWTGGGPNNFVFVDKSFSSSEKVKLVQHNIYLQAATELGYPGLLLFVAIILGCFYNHRKTRRILIEKKLDDSFLHALSHGLDISIIGFMVSAFFVSVLYYPIFWIFVIIGVALLDIAKRLPVKD